MQSAPHVIPAGALLTVPPPVPAVRTLSVNVPAPDAEKLKDSP